MLGPDLLAAPVLEPGGARTVYLPAGAWHDWWSGSRLEGPAEIEATWEPGRFPLYQRADSVVKLGRGRRVSEVLEGPIEEKRAGDAYTDL
jgi:alpha-glucosidase (family GH31 glycosyl hydrolase)